MKTIYLISLILVLGTCTKPVETPEPCIDGDGNLYPTIQIGRQLWMQENLRTTKFNNGEPIKKETDSSIWCNPQLPKKPLYCWTYNDPVRYSQPYGALYNGMVVIGQLNGGKNVCPAGWHVPTTNDWLELTRTLGGIYDAGGKLKETGFVHWAKPNSGATNSSGFTAVSNIRKTDHDYYQPILGVQAMLWTSTLNGPIREGYFPQVNVFMLIYDKLEGNIGLSFYSIEGLPVRCICDVKLPVK